MFRSLLTATTACRRKRSSSICSSPRALRASVNTTSSQNNHLIGGEPRPAGCAVRPLYQQLPLQHRHDRAGKAVPVRSRGASQRAGLYAAGAFHPALGENSTRQRRKDAHCRGEGDLRYDPSDDVFVVSTKLGITASMQLDELCCRLRPGDARRNRRQQRYDRSGL